MLCKRNVTNFPAVELDGAEETLHVVVAVDDGFVEEASAGELDVVLVMVAGFVPGDTHIFRRRNIVWPLCSALVFLLLTRGASLREMMF